MVAMNYQLALYEPKKVNIFLGPTRTGVRHSLRIEFFYFKDQFLYMGWVKKFLGIL